MILKIFSFFQSPRGVFKGSSHHRIFYSSTASLTQANNDFVPEEVRFQSNTSIIAWYPGHIAKAEKELSEYLKKVDVVIEVRDARIPYATTHPMVPTWVGNKPLIVAIARLDQISRTALADWRTYYTMNPAHPSKPDAKVFFIDGKLGAGVSALKREALKAGISVNERRMRRGIQPRPVRAAVIGFPNVGKSALINRLLGKRLAKSQNLPGVTRQLQWIRIGGGLNSNNPENALELLDSPGIIPARQFDQEAAIKLAICNDIGEASYDRVVIAGEMCNRLNALYKTNPKYVKMQHICDRYKVPFDELNGDEIVYEIANKMYHDNIISAADRLLSDFRKDVLFFGSLEAPIFNKKLLEEKDAIVQKLVEQQQLEILQNKGKKSNKKTKKGKKSVLDVDDDGDDDDGDDGNGSGEDENSPNVSPLDVGKGNYEGW